MIKIAIRESLEMGTTDIYIFDERENGSRLMATPIKFEFVPYVSGEIIEPTMRFPQFPDGQRFLYELSEALIRAGYRDKRDFNGEIKRLENHLDDMRKLVTKLVFEER